MTNFENICTSQEKMIEFIRKYSKMEFCPAHSCCGGGWYGCENCFDFDTEISDNFKIWLNSEMESKNRSKNGK